jgi:hypothetical protein
MIDRRFGTGKVAIHVRTLLTVASLVAFFLSKRLGFPEDATFVGMGLGLVVFPDRKHLVQAYGIRLVDGASFLLFLSIPLFFATVFSGFALMTDESLLGSKAFFWSAKILSLALAIPCWWAVYAVLRVFIVRWKNVKAAS